MALGHRHPDAILNIKNYNTAKSILPPANIQGCDLQSATTAERAEEPAAEERYQRGSAPKAENMPESDPWDHAITYLSPTMGVKLRKL